MVPSNTPALIRNSLHANGIHHGHGGRLSSITLDGYTFSFDHEKKVTSGGWGHIVLACNEAITAVDLDCLVNLFGELDLPVVERQDPAHIAVMVSTKPEPSTPNSDLKFDERAATGAFGF